MDPSILTALHVFIGFICCYVGGMWTMTVLDDGDTSVVPTMGHFFIGWSIGLIISILISLFLLPLLGISE